MHTRHSHRTKGFTLVELLVVIAIIAVIAMLSVTVTQRAMNSAKATKDVNNLHQTGLALTVYVTDLGYYPVGWDAGTKTSWADLIVKDQLGSSSNATQMPMFWSPLFEKDIPATIKAEAVTHFAANPAIMNEGENENGTVVPKFRLQSSQLLRPSEQILICGAVPKTANVTYHASHPVLWDMEPLVGGESTEGRPPQLEEKNANNKIEFPAKIGTQETYGSMPDFHRYNTGKGQFYFVDGHIQAMTPAEHKERNWAVSY